MFDPYPPWLVFSLNITDIISPGEKIEFALSGSLATRETIEILFGPKLPVRTDELADRGAEFGGRLRS